VIVVTRGAGGTVHFRVVDTVTGAGVSGDAENLSLWVVLDGTMIPASGSPVEVASYGGPAGWYAIELTASETDATCVTVCGHSATPGAVVEAVTVATADPGAVWDVADGEYSYGERLIVVERRLAGACRQSKGDGVTEVFGDDGETVVRVVHFSEDGSYRYQDGGEE